MERRSGLVCWNVSLGEVIREMTYLSSGAWFIIRRREAQAIYHLLGNPQFTERDLFRLGRLRPDHHSKMAAKNCKR